MEPKGWRWSGTNINWANARPAHNRVWVITQLVARASSPVLGPKDPARMALPQNRNPLDSLPGFAAG